MNKLFIIALALGMSMSMSTLAQEPVALPQPNKNVSTTLFEALQNRRSVRSFTQRNIDDATLSQLLWATMGTNRPDGRMTAPTAVNAQEISVYVATSKGVSLYLPKTHALKPVISQDIRADLAGRQTGVANAPLFFLIVADATKFGGNNNENAKIFCREDAGYVSQNINLAAVALGLGTVPRHIMNRDAVKAALHLTDDQLIILNHPIGYPKP